MPWTIQKSTCDGSGRGAAAAIRTERRSHEETVSRSSEVLTRALGDRSPCPKVYTEEKLVEARMAGNEGNESRPKAVLESR